MDLREFDQGLRAVAPQDSKPFFCEGSPMDCEVFIVGLNPGSRPPPFWPYWDVSYGFHKRLWLRAYASWTRTRRQIEVLVDALAPVRCLETNVFAACSNRLADLPRERRSTAVFDFLLRVVKPRLLFVHGGEAISHVERLAGCAFPLNQFLCIGLQGRETCVYGRNHLSFQLSKNDCRTLGTEVREHLMRLGPGGAPGLESEGRDDIRSVSTMCERNLVAVHACDVAAKAERTKAPGGLSGNEIRVLDALQDGAELTRQQIRQRTGMGEKGWSKLLGAATRVGGGVQGGGLEGKGLISTVRDACGRAVVPLRYSITEAGRKAMELRARESED